MLFYLIFVKEVPDQEKIADLVQRFLLPAACAIGLFLFGSWFFLSVMSGLILGLFGWFIPGYVRERMYLSRRKQARVMAKDFIQAASGLFSAGQGTSEVIGIVARRFPEPYAGDFQEMLGRRTLDANASYSTMLQEMAAKYGIEELNATAAIIQASENAGGPQAASEGLKELSLALRKRDKLLLEREKANIEPKIASMAVVFILGIGLVLDATVWRDIFMEGKLALAFGLLITVGLIFMSNKISANKDL